MTLTRPAESTSGERVVDRRRIRLLFPLVVMLLTLCAGATVYAMQYEPLVQGQGSALHPSSGTEVGPPWAPEDFRLLDIGDGDEFGYTVDIHNSGPLGVTIVDVGPEFDSSYAKESQLLMEPTARPRTGWGGETVPFRSFSLGPDEQRAIKALFRVVNCPTDFENPHVRWNTMSSMFVEYRVLGITRTQRVELPFTLGYRLHPARCHYGA